PFLYTSGNLHYLRSVVLTADDPDPLRRLIDVIAHRNGHRIAGAVETAKIALSDAGTTAFALPIEPQVRLEVARSDLERAIREDTARLVATVDQCCRMAAVQPERIDSVFLTGGSTGIPLVRAGILAHVPQARPVAGDMFGSVGLGLAIDAQRRFS